MDYDDRYLIDPAFDSLTEYDFNVMAIEEAIRADIFEALLEEILGPFIDD